MATAVVSPSLPLLPDTTSLHDIPYVRYSSDADVAEFAINDDDFYAHSSSIIFPQSRATLPANSDVLRQLAEDVIPRINRDSLTLRGIIIRGTASPEGTVVFNKWLGEQRAKALVDFINARLTFAVDTAKFIVNSVTEDYRYLQRMMHEAGDPDAAYIDSVCALYLPTDNLERLKYVLRHYDEARLWNRLYQQYFPQLRAVRFVLVVDRANEANEAYEPHETYETHETHETHESHESHEANKPHKPHEAHKPYEPHETYESYEITEPRRELLAIGTNLLFYGVYMPGYNRWCPIPNVAVEFYPRRGHFTFGASFDCPWWTDYWDHKFFEIRNYQLETRYYLRGSNKAHGTHGTHESHDGHHFRGLYLQAYVHGGLYDICFDEDSGWEGEGFGAGLGLGYVLRLGGKRSRWHMEFSAQVGFFRTRYDPYQWECPVDVNKHDNRYYYKWMGDAGDFRTRQYRFTWLGPTRIGVTLSYDLLYRRNEKRGVSFRRNEHKVVLIERTENEEGGDHDTP